MLVIKREYLIEIIRPYLNFKDELYKETGTEQDIVEAIIKMIRRSNRYSYKVAEVFKGDAQLIFNTLKNEFTYYREPAERQTAKTLARYIYDGRGDCKHYSTFTYCTLKYYYPVRFKLVSWDGVRPQHIYTEYRLFNKWLPIDPVFERLNYSKKGKKEWIYTM